MSAAPPVALPWGSPLAGQFITNVGLVTSSGPLGANVMPAEWVHHVSHDPGLIAISIGASSATATNVRESGEFGVNLISCGQARFAVLAGLCSGRTHDKLTMLEDMGLRAYEARKIRAPMIHGAALNAECRLDREIPLDAGRALFLGVAIDAVAHGAPPVAYHKGRFWSLEAAPASSDRGEASTILERHRRG